MLSFLLKGVTRDRTRSLFPVLVVMLGAMLTVFAHAWLAGVEADMVRSAANFQFGHLRITTRAYSREADAVPNDLAYIGVAELLSELRREHPDLVWLPRIRFGGLLDIPDSLGETRAQSPVAGLAVELQEPAAPEKKILNLEKGLVRGRLPTGPGEILISDELSQRLKLEPGARATLISSTMTGGMAIQGFTVSGTLRFGVGVLDRGTVLADLADIQQALDMPDAAGEVLGFFRDDNYDTRRAIRIALEFNDHQPDDDFSPLMMTLREQPGLASMLDMFGSYMAIILVIFVLAMAIVLWNAGLMGSLRRYGEFGIRIALGESKGHLYRTLLGESLIIGVIGATGGTALGLVFAYWLQTNGLDFTNAMRNASMMVPNVFRTRVTVTSFYIGFIPGLVATILGTAVSGIGIFRRETAVLVRELQT